MRVSEITLEAVKHFCKEDYDDQDILISDVMIPAGKAFICSRTGLAEFELDDYEDITIALLVIVSEMYDNRRLTVDTDRLNPLVRQILDLHDNNLLGGVRNET